ncbi:hypothetical protein [Streptomyces nymphaeiformis]|uniref:HNH endonuclease n=1 Tax=Streptomyces nymphaeiformis TaxID=2663842 RepID=A0A7W7U1N0_9ACTN|nr:hypothetical protein [Streptomyces nymphaeiformis]MBB4983021.1 hypothetical protein [Streptomyces nymphaeiformis]
MSEPIVAAGLFRAVMVAAGHRCQCEGACGQPHAKGAGRCTKVHDAYASKHGGPVRLMAAATNPLTPDRQAAALPASELRAWCPPCFTAARRAAQRAAAATPDADQGGLFDL